DNSEDDLDDLEPISQDQKDKSMRAFLEAVSFPAVKEHVCAVCAMRSDNTKRSSFDPSTLEERELLAGMKSALKIDFMESSGRKFGHSITPIEESWPALSFIM